MKEQLRHIANLQQKQQKLIEQQKEKHNIELDQLKKYYINKQQQKVNISGNLSDN